MAREPPRINHSAPGQFTIPKPRDVYDLDGFDFRTQMDLKNQKVKLFLEQHGPGTTSDMSTRQYVTHRLIRLFQTAIFYASFADCEKFYHWITEDLNWPSSGWVSMIVNRYAKARQEHKNNENNRPVSHNTPQYNRTLCRLVDEYIAARNTKRYLLTTIRKDYIDYVRGFWKDAMMKQNFESLLNNPPRVPLPDIGNVDWMDEQPKKNQGAAQHQPNRSKQQPTVDTDAPPADSGQDSVAYRQPMTANMTAMGHNQLGTTNSQVIGPQQHSSTAAGQHSLGSHQSTGTSEGSGPTHHQDDVAAPTDGVDANSQQGQGQALDEIQPRDETAPELMHQSEQTDEANPDADYLRTFAGNDIIDIVDTESSSSSSQETHPDQTSPDTGAAVEADMPTQAEISATVTDLARQAEGSSEGYGISVPSDHEIYVQDMEIHKLRAIALQQTCDAFASWKVSQRAIADDPNVGPELRELAEDILEEMDDVLEIMSDIKPMACRQQQLVDGMLEMAKKEKPEQ